MVSFVTLFEILNINEEFQPYFDANKKGLKQNVLSPFPMVVWFLCIGFFPGYGVRAWMVYLGLSLRNRIHPSGFSICKRKTS